VLTLFPPSPPQSGVNHNRYSTYSHSGSVKTQTSTISTAFNDIENGLRRLDDARLSKQRFEATEEKADMFAKLALGAKLERALRWRMSGQDAEYKGKLGLVQMLSLNEKAPISA
jgi:hypothetical protein